MTFHAKTQTVFSFNWILLKYEDRLVSKKEWDRLRPQDIGYKSLPVLEVDGQAIVQPLAIARYIANKYGLDGSDDMEDDGKVSASDVVNRCVGFIREGTRMGKRKKIFHPF